GGPCGLDDEIGGVFTECGEDAAGVEPADAVLAEEAIPVDVARLHLAGGGVTAVAAALGGADAVALFGEVEADARGLADPVEWHPLDVIHVDAALHDEVLKQVADFVVDDRGDDGGLEAEALDE